MSRVIGVRDMDRAISFYRDCMGLSVIRESQEWSDLSCGDGNMSLQNHQRDMPDGQFIPTMLIFTVADLDSAVAEICAAGGTLINRHDYPNAPVIVAHVGDPEGNDIQIVQEK